jgi:signal transduction histidine kinase
MQERDSWNHLLLRNNGQWGVQPEMTLLDKTHSLFWMTDNCGRLIYANAAFRRQFGEEGDQADNELQEMIPRDMAVFFSEKHRRVRQSGIPYRKIHHFIRPDGYSCCFLVTIYTIDSVQGLLTGGEAWDVSELSREKSEQELKIAETIVQVREQERTYIGHELHDNVNQIMISARLHLDALKPKTSEEQLIKSKTSELILSAIEEIRRLSRKLAATRLKDTGLLSSIAQLLNDLRSTGRFNIKFTSSLEIDTEYFLCEEKKVALFRILQEEMNNIIRHSHAKNIRVNIMQNNSGIIVYTFDDGIGFDLLTVPKGMGLANIHSRAMQFDGMVDIVTAPGKGCSVTVLMPYDR